MLALANDYTLGKDFIFALIYTLTHTSRGRGTRVPGLRWRKQSWTQWLLSSRNAAGCGEHELL